MPPDCSQCRLCALAFLFMALVWAPAAANTATGALTGKRQHTPVRIRPQVAQALESGRYEQARKFTLFKPDGLPLRAKVKPSANSPDSTRRGVTVRGWGPKKKKSITGKSRTGQLRRARRLTCRGERACVRIIAVRKACVPSSVQCGSHSCPCRTRRDAQAMYRVQMPR